MDDNHITQKEAVLRALWNGPTCGTTFLRMGIPRYAARIHELRKEGWFIERRRCEGDHYHHSRQYEYFMTPLSARREQSGATQLLD